MSKNNYQEMLEKIVKNLGGKENISLATHCVTRLRFNLKDIDLVNKDEIDKIHGVSGSQWFGKQYQIIVGSKVDEIYKELCETFGLEQQNKINENLDKKKLTYNDIIQYISGSLIDTMPGFLGAAFVTTAMMILSTAHLLSTDSTTYKILTILGQSFTTFLPIMIGMSAAKRLNTSQYLAAAIAAMMVSPDLAALFASGERVTLYGIPVTAAYYQSSIFPILMIVPVMKVVYDFLGKYMPSLVKMFLQPLLTLLVMAPVALCVLGPLGGFIGNYLAMIVNFCYDKIGWLTITLLTIACPFIIMTGMHYGLIPIMTTCFATFGYDPILMVMMIINNMAQGGAALGVAAKTKKSDVRSTAMGSGLSCVLAGVTEPAMFGINLHFRKPMIAACIGAGLAGLIGGIFHLKMYGGLVNVFGVIGFFGADGISNVVLGIVCMAIAFFGAFIATQLLYKDIEEN